MDQADYDIAIVGAGIAGGALARALVAQGWRLCVIEAGELRGISPPAEQGVDGFDARVSALTPASTELLDRLGAWRAVAAARSCPYRHMHVWDADGSGAIDFDFKESELGYNCSALNIIPASLSKIT